ncbi:MAG: HD domain-containing protein [Candidatus Hermodarchaeota archaeon]
MLLPTFEEIKLWFKLFRLPKEVIDHCTLVSRVSLFLGKKLREKGQDINLELLEKGALLHDLDKIISLERKQGHGETTAQFLSEQGMKEVALIAYRHRLDRLGTEDEPATWCEKIVFYADKICQNSTVTSLENRLKDLNRRYPEYRESFYEKKPLILALEKEIFNYLDFSPKELVQVFEGNSIEL